MTSSAADFCAVFSEYLRFYVEGRKNDAMGCAFLDIARPANGDPDGVYFIFVWAKGHFCTGHVLPHIDRRTGEVDRTRPMSIGDFVAFLRSALVPPACPRRRRPCSRGRASGPGARPRPRPRGCTRRTSSTWWALPARSGSPGTAAISCRSGCASRAPSAFETSKEEGRCLWKEMCFGGARFPPRSTRRGRELKHALQAPNTQTLPVLCHPVCNL
jgi:hypothetical protein